ncbi:MAG TPA: hypothetical protein VKT32_09005 [Chthonomonadaceae bacterium]|nr:hypothetical protein [Chthonomonadaceae bacterium]
MKCIHCGSNSTYAVRRSNGGRCGACKHPFAFEPKTDPLGIADGAFQKMIQNVSGEGKLFFTEKQLWYEFNRQILKKRVASCGASTAVLVCGLLLAWALRPVGPAVLGMAFAALCLMATTRSTRPKPTTPLYARMPQSQFQGSYLSKWMHAHGPIEKLMMPPARSTGSFPSSVAPDVTAYSFDRVLVTEHADTAAMLVANNFHFENNCAILSLDGYPYDRFDTILEMLRRNPLLKVFVLHDATPEGCNMALSLRDTRWFPDPAIRIIDLGLRPLHAQQARMVLLKEAPRPLPPTGRSTLTAPELAWLAEGNRAEVAAVRPAKLMRAVYQGFARANQMGSEAEDVYSDTGVAIWIYDSNVDIYASDSFG